MRAASTAFAVLVSLLGLLLLVVGAGFGINATLEGTAHPANPAATGAACGGVSGPGRTLAAYNWVANAASSAALIGSSLSASTDRYSLVLMELIHSDAVEHAQRVVSEHGQ